MPASRSLRALALALLLPALGGCYYLASGALLGASIGAASTPRPMPVTSRYRPGSALVVDFLPERDVVAAAARRGDDSLRIASVHRVVGRVLVSRGDTLTIAITELRRRGAGPVAFAQRHEPIMQLPPDVPARINVLTSNANVAQRAVLGGFVGLGLSYLALYALCYYSDCYGT